MGFGNNKNIFVDMLAVMPQGLRPHVIVLALLVLLVVMIYSWQQFTATDMSGDAATGTAVASIDAAPSEATRDTVETLEKQPVWDTYTVASGDTLSTIFKAKGFDASSLNKVLASSKAAKKLVHLRVGDQLKFKTDAAGELVGIKYPLTKLDTLLVSDGNHGWNSWVRHLKPTPHTVVKDGDVNQSLGGSLRGAGLSSALAADFVKIFHWKVDFRRDMRPGASFAVIYQQMLHRGKPLGHGPIEAAELDNNGRTLQVFRYKNGKGGFSYYTADGHSLKPSILRTPVNYTRVSSHFSRNRLNPVLHIWRPHYGVDLAAPMGTPIRAAADGVVKYIGAARGYGRLIELRNFGPYTTRYGHMSRFAKGLKKGDHVHQGEVIAYVGQAGIATGPHLHFEIRINGKPYPPLKVKLPDSHPLPQKLMAGFEKKIKPFFTVLKYPDSTRSEQKLAALDEQPLTTASLDRTTDQGREL